MIGFTVFAGHLPPFFAVIEEEVTEPSNVGMGSVVLTVVGVAFLGWVGWLVINSRRRARREEEVPTNLQPYLSDDELETSRVTSVLNAALIVSAVLAIALPIYYINEGNRQAAAAEKIEEQSVEEGSHWYTQFACVDCHGPDAGGGAAAFIEPRSGLETSWAAPSLNDVFYRYSEDEVRYWIEFGRDGTPMPANGLEGGGAMTFQEIDQVIAYLHSLQLTQEEATTKVERIVAQELDRIALGDAVVARLIEEQELAMEEIATAPERFAVIDELPAEVRFLLSADGTCTSASAALVDASCGEAGTDTDRDGLTDAVETRLSEIGAIVDDTVVIRQVRDQTTEEGEPVVDAEGNPVTEVVEVPDSELAELYGLRLDPNDAFSTETQTGEPMSDLDRVAAFLTELDTAHLTLSVLTERNDVFMEGAVAGLQFLERAAEERAWNVDFDAVAAGTGLSRDDAERAVALFNGYCARCHTAGYSAGVAFEQGPGTGAWGPSLRNGKALVQFPDAQDQIDFVVEGSQEAVNFGVNGLGTGRMPGFGQMLSAEDIALIVTYERSL